jgi:short-subunit dehydrogenase
MGSSTLFKIFVMQPTVVPSIGYKALIKGKPEVIAGAYNKALVIAVKLLPFSITNPVMKKMVKRA